MATLERLKYYSHFLTDYISMRFGLLKFLGFSILLVLLAASETLSVKNFAENFIFVFATLFVFRLNDDCWSFYLDRKNHPEREYINSENIKTFITITTAFLIIYQITLLLISPPAGIAIFLLLLVTNGLYLLSYESKNAMRIIPLLKYPVIIWCISQFSMSSGIILLSVSGFFMMLAFDFYDEHRPKTNSFFVKTVLILTTGLLILQPWKSNDQLLIPLFLLLSPFTIFLLPEFKLDKFLLLVIFPAVHLIDLFILT